MENVDEVLIKVNLSRGACVDDNVTSVDDRVTGVNCRKKRVVDRVASVDHSSHVHTPSKSVTKSPRSPMLHNPSPRPHPVTEIVSNLEALMHRCGQGSKVSTHQISDNLRRMKNLSSPGLISPSPVVTFH